MDEMEKKTKRRRTRGLSVLCFGVVVVGGGGKASFVCLRRPVSSGYLKLQQVRRADQVARHLLRWRVPIAAHKFISFGRTNKPSLTCATRRRRCRRRRRSSPVRRSMARKPTTIAAAAAAAAVATAHNWPPFNAALS